MAQAWNKLDKTEAPALATMADFVASPRWDAFLAYMEEAYQPKQTVEYSGCGMMSGWNLKLKKSGKSLCTLYPEPGYFVVLVVIGQKEKAETEQALPTLTPYTQNLYAKAKEGMGQRWLMFRVDNDEVMADVKQCIAIRRKSK